MNDSIGLARPLAFHPGWLPVEGGERTLDSRVPFGAAELPAPLVYDETEPALRRRELNFAAKRLADMAFVSALDWSDALGRLRWRGVPPMSGLSVIADQAPRRKRLEAALAAGQIDIRRDTAARTVRL